MFTTRLVFRNNDTHAPIMAQEFKKEFKTAKAAEKFLLSRVEGMKAISLEPNVTIYGQIIKDEKVSVGIALF